jgi:ABC-type uncharacterized transport system substrate-binding protein
VSSGAPTLAALQQTTRAIPLVFGQVAEPVAAGFVDSLSRPGGNITGFSSFEYAMGGKWLGTLKEMVPNIIRFAVLRDPGSGVGAIGVLGAIQAVMPSFALPLTIASGRDAAEFERVIDAFANEPNGGLIVLPAPNTIRYRQAIIASAAAASHSNHLSVSILRERRRAHIIRDSSIRHVSAGGRLCRCHSQRGKAL